MMMDFIKKVLKVVNFVMEQEMKQIIIVQFVKQIIIFLKILFIKIIVIKNVHFTIIIMKKKNVFVQIIVQVFMIN